MNNPNEIITRSAPSWLWNLVDKAFEDYLKQVRVELNENVDTRINEYLKQA